MIRPIESDQRYTISREFCGYESPRYVLRFCGDWVDQFKTHEAAINRAVGLCAERRAALIIEAVE
jgi:hypothetical protein